MSEHTDDPDERNPPLDEFDPGTEAAAGIDDEWGEPSVTSAGDDPQAAAEPSDVMEPVQVERGLESVNALKRRFGSWLRNR